jgi:hypothetical protein
VSNFRSTHNSKLNRKFTNMKKTLVIAGLLSGAMGVYAQGTLNWNSQSDWLISVYSPSTGSPNLVQSGNSPQDVPAGTTDYTGGWIGGGATSPGTGVGGTPSSGPGGYNYQNAASFEAGLYIDTSSAAVLTDIQTLSPLATTGISDGALVAVNSLATDPSIPGGTQVNVGLAAWYTDGGLYGSYSAATAAQQPAGYSISTSQLALGTQTGTPVVIGPSLGLNSFSLALTSVPEPSTIALGVIGASTFLLRLRRKQ